jgi:lipopolysaccharide transport system ATP-binding protein
LSNSVIIVENLSKKYIIGRQKSRDLRSYLGNWFSNNREKDTIWALKDVNFSVEQGEILGIIGPNGSGKSTLLKILSKITYPSSGKVSLKGKVSSLLEVGTGFHPELTGRENIYLNGSLLGMQRNEIKKKFDEIVDFSGVEKFIDTPVKHFSSGMYVRLAFSIAAHLQPDILLVDEVLSVGDFSFRKKSLDKMNKVSKSGKTILFVSHNLGILKNICSKGVLLNSGKMQYYEDVNEMINIYTNSPHNVDPFPKLIKHSIYDFSFQILDKSGNKTKVAECGEALKINIGFNSEIAFENVNIRLDVKNEDGNKIMVFSNYLTGDIIGIKKGLNKILCAIPELNFNTGKYLFDLVIKWKKKEEIEFQNIGELSVFEGNYFKTGKMPSKEVNILTYHFWKS